MIVESSHAIRSCEVYSITGQRVISFENCPERLEIPVEKLAQGTYLVKLVTDQFVQTRKFVKK